VIGHAENVISHRIVKWVADVIMQKRARALYRRVSRHLPLSGTIADIGSGTGHNADQIRRRTSLIVKEYDVADLHWIGPGPALMSAESVPATNRSFDALLLLFVLQYPEFVSRILSEARRVTVGPVIVLQSTYSGRWGRLVLWFREFFWGRMAFRLANFAGLVPSDQCPLHPRHVFTRQELLEQFHRTGFNVRTMDPSNWPGLNVSRDLFVLEAI
jgi:hypothetical protein